MLAMVNFESLFVFKSLNKEETPLTNGKAGHYNLCKQCSIAVQLISSFFLSFLP